MKGTAPVFIITVAEVRPDGTPIYMMRKSSKLDVMKACTPTDETDDLYVTPSIVELIEIFERMIFMGKV